MNTFYLKIIFSFVIAFNCLCYGHAQDFWEALPVHDSLHIQCIAINNSNHLFISSGSATTNSGLYRSTDGGQNWELIFDNGEIMINPIEINPDGEIFIGKGGFDPLRVSLDNGNTWDSLFYPGTGNFSAMYSPGHDTLFVCGAYIARTYDNASTWDTIFTTENGTEYIKDILQTQSGDIYIALTGYFPDMGGVYKSTDGGDSWEFSGLFNYMMSSLAENSEGDVFAGARGILQSGLSPGLFVLRKGENEWEELLGGHQIADVAINSDDHIYCAVESSIGVIRSVDNGQNFEIVNEGLSSGIRRKIIFDNIDYAYVTNHISLARSINPTVSITEKYQSSSAQSLIIYPNPARKQINILNLPENHSNYCLLSIFNSMGSLIMNNQRKICSDQCRINVSSLESGYYLVRIIDNNVIKYGRFLKQ